jgi:hypothetical protein
MDKAEQAHKLAQIPDLPAEELRGWWRYVITRGFRAEFDGERAALLRRAQQLGISFNEVPT